jgi:hypothetical protein
VVPAAESAIAGKRLTLIEQAKGCHESMAPFFCLFFADTKRLYTDDLVNAVVIAVKSGTLLPTAINTRAIEENCQHRQPRTVRY